MTTLTRCPACSDPVTASARFCASCGVDLEASSAPTGTAPAARTPPGSGARRPPGSGSGAAAGTPLPGGGRFVPGTVLLDRYRVIQLLGRGGMGEVYRAEDLLLGQSVALKFLPASLREDPERLARFYNEARIAREVTHPAVCRVHDIGQVDGHTFLSMEYVDGEDLASLLRRIGRLPRDKALEIAQQLCAGVAAAHDKGVVHRDLKPQNVMLDGEGKVRIADFGLAGLAGTIQGEEARSGTPGYMSPEQLAGREATAKSDIYAIGLILYELFTGQRAYPGHGPAEVRKQHDEPLRPPSSLVEDLDPAVERAVLHCLEDDPGQRPASARRVAALLPGGDPLAAALLAGETPSPEMVASARSEGLRPALAWTCVAIVAACTIASVGMMHSFLLLRRVPEARPPAALEDRARDFLRRLGFESGTVDRARGIGVDSDYFRWAMSNDRSPRRWEKLRTGDPPVAEFWYREAPLPLVPMVRDAPTIAWWDPPWLVSGMVGVRLDLSGRLLEFQAVPPQLETLPPPETSEPDWSPLFAQAGLDPARFTPVTPAWTPQFYCDRRQAWEGTYPRRPEIPLRVEAAAYRGRPVSFQLVSPWTHPYRMQPFRPTFTENVNALLTTAMMFLLFAVGGWLAWRNLKLGRGDRRGAARLAGAILLTGVAVWILSGHHVRDRNGFMNVMGEQVGGALRLAFVLWVFYLALEPYVRRFWPRTIVSWTRLLTNGPRDPVVGRDALIGMVAGGAIAVVLLAAAVLAPRWGGPEPMPVANLDPALGLRYAAASMLYRWVNALMLAMGSLLLLLFLKLILRSERAAAWLLVAVLALTQALSLADDNSSPWVAGALGFIVMAQYTFLLRRVGVVACLVAVVVANLLVGYPLTIDVDAWYGWVTLLIVGTLAALAAHAFRTSVRRAGALAALTLASWAGLPLPVDAAEHSGPSWNLRHGDLRVSDDRRFVVHQDGTPFLYLGDTAWELFHRLDREDAARYLETRRRQGFTVIQAVLLAEFDGLDEPNAYGHRPLLEHDPARPDVKAGPRNDYWDHVDDLVALARERGLYMGLLPTWGDKAGPKKWGQGPVIFTEANARAYGRFLGERYREAPNVIWILGGDRPAIDDKEGDFRAVWHAMAAGIEAGDGGRHLITYHPMGGRSSSEWFQETPWLDFNMLQSGHGAKDGANYKMIAADYARLPAKPVLDGEPRYEDHPVNWKPEMGWFDEHDVRQAAYWALFAGAFGHTYGCHDVWQMWTPARKPVSSARTDWRQAVELPGAWQMGHVRRLLLSRPFLSRIPDPALVAGGQGDGADHVEATRDRGGSYAFVYVPTGRPVTVDLTRLSGARVKAWWFDPRTGQATAIGEWARAGMRAFTPPGTPGRGHDWVLALDDPARGFPPPGEVR